jgi:hypothetical protein
MTSINDDWLLYEYERTVLIKRIEDNFNQISQKHFEGSYGTVSVTDNGDYLTVRGHSLFVGDYDTQKLFDVLENYSQKEYEISCYDLWDCLDNCKYTLPENQETDNELKTDDELSFFQKRQVSLVNMLLGEPVINKDSISNEELWEKSQQLTNLAQRLKWENLELTQSLEEMHNFRRRELKEGSEIISHLTARVHELKQYKEYNEVWIENLKQRIHDLECTVFLLQKETNQVTVLNETITQLQIRIYQLEQENKQLKSSQLEAKPEPKSDKKPTAKKSKFKLPENFADYQQECDDLIDALSCFYNIKKGKWNGNILQFILTPTDAEKARHWLCPMPDKWKAGLYLRSGQWIVDKVNLSDPDEWSDYYIDINDFADANDIEIS